ncbi:unnamed protein product [Fructobacillus tropaeoli]|uniref:hypothetical protein n=1 Tax=Fructobacillus tropaeoli TaxID=709323 RepID=UPI002D8C0403|nr:unnamed protein product [Fructobacillus tropaeoli]
MFVKFIQVIDNENTREYRLDYGSNSGTASLNKKTGQYSYTGYKGSTSITNPSFIEKVVRKSLTFKENKQEFVIGAG